MDQPPKSQRETLLTLGLVVVFGGAMVFFLNLVSMGVFFYVIVAVVAITLLGWVHYALWGQAMAQEVAQEREELEARERLELDNDPYRDKIQEDITRYRRY